MTLAPRPLRMIPFGTLRRRGRPQIPWQSLDDELACRLAAGTSAATIMDEARALESWARVFMHLPDEAGRKRVRVPSLSAIRQRISRRFGGASGYRGAREVACNMSHRSQLRGSLHRMSRAFSEPTDSRDFPDAGGL